MSMNISPIIPQRKISTYSRPCVNRDLKKLGIMMLLLGETGFQSYGKHIDSLANAIRSVAHELRILVESLAKSLDNSR
jgi:hypothetical protein